MRIHSIFIALLLCSVFSENKSHTVITLVFVLRFFIVYFGFLTTCMCSGGIRTPDAIEPYLCQVTVRATTLVC